jgi:predicted N-acetyltransferase YhbS
MNIRLANPHDTDEVCQWIYHEWSSFYPEQDLNCLRQEIFDWLNNEDEFLFVAEENQKLLGCISITKNDFPERPALNPWLANLYVKKSGSNKNIAKKLVLFAIEFARKNNMKDLYGIVFKKNHIRLYERLAFSQIEKIIWQNKEIYLIHKEL